MCPKNVPLLDTEKKQTVKDKSKQLFVKKNFSIFKAAKHVLGKCNIFQMQKVTRECQGAYQRACLLEVKLDMNLYHSLQNIF